jgi:hypothetical protein
MAVRSKNRGIYKSDYGIIDMYRHYRNTQKNKGIEPVDISTYRKIIKSYNIQICDYIVKESGELRLPHRLGYLRIRKFKTKLKLDHNGQLITRHLQPNWKATNKLWEENENAKKEKKIVWHTNKHTNGYYYKWYWDKRACNITNHTVYSLVMSRDNKRNIARTINENENIDYYE